MVGLAWVQLVQFLVVGLYWWLHHLMVVLCWQLHLWWALVLVVQGAGGAAPLVVPIEVSLSMGSTMPVGGGPTCLVSSRGVMLPVIL